MKYVKYQNLVDEGNIIVWIEQGILADPVVNPGKDKWNGVVVVLDFDVQDMSHDSVHMITLGEKERKRPCFLTRY